MKLNCMYPPQVLNMEPKNHSFPNEVFPILGAYFQVKPLLKPKLRMFSKWDSGIVSNAMELCPWHPRVVDVLTENPGSKGWTVGWCSLNKNYHLLNFTQIFKLSKWLLGEIKWKWFQIYFHFLDKDLRSLIISWGIFSRIPINGYIFIYGYINPITSNETIFFNSWQNRSFSKSPNKNWCTKKAHLSTKTTIFTKSFIISCLSWLAMKFSTCAFQCLGIDDLEIGRLHVQTIIPHSMLNLCIYSCNDSRFKKDWWDEGSISFIWNYCQQGGVWLCILLYFYMVEAWIIHSVTVLLLLMEEILHYLRYTKLCK